MRATSWPSGWRQSAGCGYRCRRACEAARRAVLPAVVLARPDRPARVIGWLPQVCLDPGGQRTACLVRRAGRPARHALRDRPQRQPVGWWGDPGPDAVVTGSHLDSVPDGGAFDGPLGIVSGFLAVEELRGQGLRPHRPVAVIN